MTEINLPQFSDTDTTNIGDIVENYINPYIGGDIQFNLPYNHQIEIQSPPSFLGLIPAKTDYIDQYTITFQDNLIITNGVSKPGQDGITDTIIINDVNGMSITLNDFEGKERGFYENVLMSYSGSEKLSLKGNEITNMYDQVNIYAYAPFTNHDLILDIAIDVFGYNPFTNLEGKDENNDGLFDNANGVLDVNTFKSAKSSFNQ